MTVPPRSDYLKSVSSVSNVSDAPIAPAKLVYHESARSIVFRDDLRRQQRRAVLPRSRDHSPDPSSLSATKKSNSVMSSASTAASATMTPPRAIPVINPLPKLEFGFNDEFPPLSSDYDNMEEIASRNKQTTAREMTVINLLRDERAVVKTLRNMDWTTFLERFIPKPSESSDDGEQQQPDTFPSFVTSTSILPSMGKKMRCYGSTKEFTIGCMFALPTNHSSPEEEDEIATKHKRWSWPSGYSAKTEFNIDKWGNLLNGREEALVSVNGLRRNNHSYLHDTDYMIGGRIVKGGLNTIPYNEFYVAVGGIAPTNDDEMYLPKGRSYENGIGMPIALFVRTACFGHLVSLLRTRSRLVAILGKEHFGDIPLLMICPDRGVRVLTHDLQAQLFQILAHNLNPFTNPSLYKTTIDNTTDEHMRQKLEELIDLNDNGLRTILTVEECAKIAGGFGATDDSVAELLMDAMHEDQVYERTHSKDEQDKANEGETGDDSSVQSGNGHKLQHIVNEGLVAAVRAGDYHTSRQLLILYTLVASRGSRQQTIENGVDEKLRRLSIGSASSGASELDADDDSNGSPARDIQTMMQLENPIAISNTKKKKKVKTLLSLPRSRSSTPPRHSSGSGPGSRSSTPPPSSSRSAPGSRSCTPPPSPDSAARIIKPTNELSTNQIPPPPPPPPLDTDRLRSATNSDGLLAVLGAAQVLKAMQDGSSRRRVKEAVVAVEEWIVNGEQSVTFRLASWREQRVAQGDLKIAMEHDSSFTAFVGNHAISNRKNFAARLRESIDDVNVENISFLKSIHCILDNMHSPCLRLELLQYILGLDNRYSVAHVARSVELAATCMNISMHEAVVDNNGDQVPN